MAPVSLADASVTSATPGVLVKGTVDPAAFQLGLQVVSSNILARRISDQIDSSSIVNGDTAYWSLLFLRTNGSIVLRLAATSTDSDGGQEAGPQFTQTARDNIWVVLFYGATSAKWDFSKLDDSDSTEPYAFSDASVTAAGPTNNTRLRNAINRDSTVIAMIVDASHPRIDIDNLMLLDDAPSDRPEDVHLGAATVAKMYAGSDEVAALYLGDTRVF